MSKTKQPTSRPDDGRRKNGGARSGTGPKPKRKTLVLNGVIQDGHWRLVAVTGDTLVLDSVTTET